MNIGNITSDNFNLDSNGKDIQIEVYEQLIEKLQQENKQLKEQLKYLRSGEYYNQLRFENEMLQQVVDTNGVPSEVYDYIDCTHRNTELLEENQKLKKQLTTYQILHRDCKVDNLKNISKIEEMENQQKEFIEYLEEEMKRLEENDIYEPLQRMALATHQHNLLRFKEIIGVSK